ncbi:MAG: OsmC family protein [Acidimicrobiia bacterium]|nr:OsmC family protein [Acidimicrobiia bacterium]
MSTYSVSLETSEPKRGTVASPADGLPGIAVAPPPEFGGPEGVWSPEHFFVAALSSCLMTTFFAIAGNSGLEVVSYSDQATGELTQDETKRYRIESVTLRPRIVVSDESKVDKARRIIEKSEGACLISRSVNSEVFLEATIEVAG